MFLCGAFKLQQNFFQNRFEAMTLLGNSKTLEKLTNHLNNN